MSEMNGFISVLKPPGMTSHDVVAWLRRVLRTKAIGHAGTLDPAAAGVLPVAVGKATRLLEYIGDSEKQYIGEVTFGIATDTLDQEGTVTEYKPVPTLTERLVRDNMHALQGVLWQKPPAFSAVKHAGKPLYKYAREGRTIDVEARCIRVQQFELLSFTAGTYPKCLFRVKCSKGTYIRVLAQDLATSVNASGCLTFLLRSQVGQFAIETAWTLDEIQLAQEENRRDEFLLPLSLGVAELMQVRLDPTQALRFLHGQKLKGIDAPHAGIVAVFCEEELLGVADNLGGLLSPRKVVAKGEELGLQ